MDAEISKASHGGSKTYIWTPEFPVAERIASLLNPDSQAPLRWLPPGQPSDVYLQFLAWAETQGRMKRSNEQAQGRPSSPLLYIPSWSTFWKVWSGQWAGRLLKFRPTSNHTECTKCWEFRQSLHFGKCSAEERVTIAARWRQHMADSYHDRLLYYTMRYASRCRMNVLTIMTDSMDKSKWCYPRWKFGRISSEMEKVHRPKIVVTVCMAHGHTLGVFLQDSERVTHGANCFIEQSASDNPQVLSQHAWTLGPAVRQYRRSVEEFHLTCLGCTVGGTKALLQCADVLFAGGPHSRRC